MSLQEAHDAARVQRDETPQQKRYRLACQKRRDDLRAQGLCIFCGRAPGAPLCRECRQRQSERARVRYRALVAEARAAEARRRCARVLN